MSDARPYTRDGWRTLVGLVGRFLADLHRRAQAAAEARGRPMVTGRDVRVAHRAPRPRPRRRARSVAAMLATACVGTGAAQFADLVTDVPTLVLAVAVTSVGAVVYAAFTDG